MVSSASIQVQALNLYGQLTSWGSKSPSVHSPPVSPRMWLMALLALMLSHFSSSKMTPSRSVFTMCSSWIVRAPAALK